MSILPPDNCPHETRPGTVVCLHCRHEARMAVRAARQQKIGRIFVAIVIVGVIGAAAGAGASAMQSRWDWKEVIPTLAANFGSTAERGSSSSSAPAERTSERAPTLAAQLPNDTMPASDSVAGDSLGTDSLAVDSARSDSTVFIASSDSAPAPAAAPAIPVTAPAPIATRMDPAIAEGRTELGDSVFALREGSIVTVHFDTPMGRTRRRDKFESMVRRTLPRVFGPAADSALAAIPSGALTASGDLVTELPSTGIRLSLSNGSTLSIWPRTRPGRDGPLVVAYRAIVSR